MIKTERALSPAEFNAIRTLTLDEAKGRKMTAEAEMAELELARIRGELVKTDDVVRAWDDVLRAMRAKLLAIPTKLASAVSHESDPNLCKSIMDKEIEDALHELANYQPSVDATKPSSASQQVEDSDGLIEATAQAHRKRMGRPRKASGQSK